MDPARMHRIMSGRALDPGAHLLRALMWTACGTYAAAVRLRRWLYRTNPLLSRSAPVPVISVGNITTGGTGKTPMTAWVVQRLTESGKSPAILTRGYKSSKGASDEPQLLRQSTGAAVVVNPNRVAGAKQAAADGADVCVMDDGFQHRRLRRDLDIVLVDATNPFGYGYCLPRGLLREPLNALTDAHAIVITRSDMILENQMEDLASRLGELAPQASVHRAVHRPTGVIDEAGLDVPAQTASRKRAYAFCGLGNPESFLETLAHQGIRVVGSKMLADHVGYDSRRIEAIEADAHRQEAEVLITTQKDYVKLPAGAFDIPVWQLGVEIQITAGRDELVEKINRAARKATTD